MQPSATRRVHPDERVRARCSRAVATRLMSYDHHVVWVDGRPAVLITYPLLEVELSQLPEPIWCEASLTHAAGHPTAPAEIQAIARALSWEPSVPGVSHAAGTRSPPPTPEGPVEPQ